MLALLLALAILVSAGFLAAQEVKPPVAPVRNVVDDYYGVKVDDPYRYLEKLDDPEVAAWFKAQATYTDATLAAIPGRNAMLARLQELDRGAPALVQHVRRFPQNRIYYEKRPAGENVLRLYVRDGFGGVERLLVNPETFAAKPGEPMSLDWWEPSRDGRFVVFGISRSGSEQAVLHIVNTASGELLPDTIDRCRQGEVSWAEDNSFFYNRLQKVTTTTPPTEYLNNSRLYRHVIGRDAEQDPVVLGPGALDGRAEAFHWRPVAVITPGSHYMLGVFTPGAEKRKVIYKQPIDSLGTRENWTPIIDLADDVVGFAVHGDELYLVSQHNSSHRQLLVLQLSDPDPKNTKVLIPQSASVIEEITAASDALYVRITNGGSGHVLRLKYGSHTATAVPQPKSTIVWSFDANPQVAGVVLGVGSWVQRDATYVYEPARGTVTATGLEPQSAADLRGLQVSDVHVKSYDGTLVPLSIISKAGLPRDGSNPTLLFGYGAYGTSMEPFFQPLYQPWFEHGGILAVAHVRGGGEYGEEWHSAGKGLAKQNTWKDFIACAQYMIENKYTSPKRLGTLSGSAGGVMVGMAMMERPDLFAGVIDAVPAPDMLRYELTPNGPGNVVEFGTVTNRDGFDGLLKMSAYHHVKDGTPYPAVLITMGFNDARVVPWEPGKFAARLQAATSSGKPVLLRVDYDGGHGVSSTQGQRQRETADQFSFLLWQMGVPGFQPAKP